MTQRILKSQRIQYIDSARGVGILLVLLGHSLTLVINPINKFILSFHMPLFFIISGMVFSLSTQNSLVYLKKKFLSIAMPILTAAIFSISYELLFDILIFQEKNIQDFQLLNKFDNWFLYTLFFAEVFTFLIVKSNSQFIFYSGLFLSIVIFQFTNQGIRPFAKYIETTSCALPFMLLGYKFGIPAINSISIKTKKWFINPITIFTTLTIVLSTQNDPVTMASNVYGNKILFSLNAILGSIATLLLANLLSKSRFLQYLGINSIYIYVTHFFVLRFLISIWNQFNLGTYYDYPNFIFIFLILISIDLSLVYILSKYTPFLFGKFNH